MKLLIIILIIAAFSAGYTLRVTENAMSARAGHDRQFEVIQMEVTAYSPSPNQTQGNPFQMASGRIAEPSELEQLLFIAASRDLMNKYNLKYGNVVYIGFELQDTMAAKVTNHLDLFVRSISLARKFGRQDRTIIVERR